MVEGCVFCGIAEGRMKAHVLYEDSSVIAFLDIKPKNPGHTLVVPKKHFVTIFEMDDETIGSVYKAVRKLAPAVVKAVGADGVNTIQSNIVSQGVNHFHTHVLPRFFNDGMPIVWESSDNADDRELSRIEKSVKSLL